MAIVMIVVVVVAVATRYSGSSALPSYWPKQGGQGVSSRDWKNVSISAIWIDYDRDPLIHSLGGHILFKPSFRYEMEMFHRSSLKLGLEQAVLKGMERDGGDSSGKAGAPKLSKEDIDNLLRHGAYDVFREDREGKSEEESAKFCEATIEDILEKKSHTITVGGPSSVRCQLVSWTQG